MLCRSRVSSIVPVVRARSFWSSSASLAPAAPPAPKNHNEALVNLANELVNKAEVQEESTSILRNLYSQKTISPYHLSPAFLLNPYLPRANYTLAYPLGPPVREAKTLDPFARLGLDPLASPMNPYLRSDFCTNMGKIHTRGKTLLQRGSQRKLGKAVRRARSMGIVAVFGKSVPGGR